MNFYKFIEIFQIFSLVLIVKSEAARNISKYNVVLVVFDDLRASIGGYGDKLAQTPNLDAFMNKSFYFTRTYSQV